MRPGPRNLIQRMVQQGLACNGNQGLWPIRRQGGHACAKARGEQHHRVRFVPHCARILSKASGVGAGK